MQNPTVREGLSNGKLKKNEILLNILYYIEKCLRMAVILFDFGFAREEFSLKTFQ